MAGGHAMRSRLQRVKMGVTRTSCLPRSGDSPDAIPVFATAAHAAILAPMPTLKINATQPWLIAQPGNVAEITPRLAVMNLALRGIEADFGPEHADTFRRALIEADLVDGMVALPGQLFYRTQIPACLWFGVKNNALEAPNDARLFDGETELSLVA